MTTSPVVLKSRKRPIVSSQLLQPRCWISSSRPSQNLWFDSTVKFDGTTANPSLRKYIRVAYTVWLQNSMSDSRVSSVLLTFSSSNKQLRLLIKPTRDCVLAYTCTYNYNAGYNMTRKSHVTIGHCHQRCQAAYMTLYCRPSLQDSTSHCQRLLKRLPLFW